MANFSDCISYLRINKAELICNYLGKFPHENHFYEFISITKLCI